MQYKIFNQDQLVKSLTNKKTPCYLYDTHLLNDTLDRAKNSSDKYLPHSHHIHYALKANDNPDLLAIIKQQGIGIDCVSGGEIEKAIKAGFDANDIVFAGVGKQDWEIILALKHNIYAFNCESLQELEIINALAHKYKKIVKGMLRVNPDIDAKTHKHISTGKYDNKFGIMFDDIISYLPKLKELKNIQLIGLHYHIGSQITRASVFAKLASIVTKHYNFMQKKGVSLTDINLGGGLGIDYKNPHKNPIPDFDKYFATINAHLNIPKTITLHFELGRSLVGQCGILISTVLFTKNTAGTNFAIVDAGMNDLMRPALYNAKHNIIVLNHETKPQSNLAAKVMPYHIVGPVCESTDIFARNLLLTELKRGDKIIIETCGAYGRVLANQYNSRNLITEYTI